MEIKSTKADATELLKGLHTFSAQVFSAFANNYNAQMIFNESNINRYCIKINILSECVKDVLQMYMFPARLMPVMIGSNLGKEVVKIMCGYCVQDHRKIRNHDDYNTMNKEIVAYFHERLVFALLKRIESKYYQLEQSNVIKKDVLEQYIEVVLNELQDELLNTTCQKTVLA